MYRTKYVQYFQNTWFPASIKNLFFKEEIYRDKKLFVTSNYSVRAEKNHGSLNVVWRNAKSKQLIKTV